jgi:hypothetical protein
VGRLKRVKVAKTRGDGTYTEAAFWGFIRSGLRAKYQRWKPRYTALKNARRAYKGPNKQQKWEFLCELCDRWHMQKDVEVDHIVPCGSLKSYDDLPGFVERLFCEVDGLRVVCKPCHKEITAESRSG